MIVALNRQAAMNDETKKHNGSHKRVRTLVVDDSATFRTAVGHLLAGMSQVELVGTAEDGRHAKEIA